jgi:hypothetical protein
MSLRAWTGLALASATLLVCLPAHAWQEAHEASDDVRVHVDTNGKARVEHKVGYRIVRGPLKSFDLVGVEKGATVEPNVTVAADDGRTLDAHAAMHDERTLRVSIDEPRALMRGTFTFTVRYEVDLVAGQELSRDGSVWRLAWSAPIATDGFDGAHTVFELPAGRETPQPIEADTGAVDESAIATLTRNADGDLLELVRPHVARGEAVRWNVRLDPKAFPEVKDPRLRPPPEPPPPAPDRIRETSLVAGLAGLALAFGLLVLHKGRAFAAACAALGAKPRALVGGGDGVRAAIAGVALAAGVGLELADAPTLGALAIAVAMAAASLRTPEARAAARGPGKWLPVRPEDAFEARARCGHWLDASTLNGKKTMIATAVGAGALAWGSCRIDAEAPWLVVLDSLALLPLFVTGCTTQLPPDAARAPARWLAQLARKLRFRPSVRAVPWARVPAGQATPDELRLLALPRVAMPGLVGIEVGLAWGRGATGWSGAPEVLVRVLDASAAASRLCALLPRTRPVPGRRPEERVFPMVPRFGTRAGTLALVERVAKELVDRRVTIPAKAWSGAERRAAESARIALAPGAA